MLTKDVPFHKLSNEPGAIAWNGLWADFEAKYCFKGGVDASVMDLGGPQGVYGAPPKVIDGLEGFDFFSILFDWVIIHL